MRVTLVISSLSSGGSERVMSILANQWVARGKKVTLITLAAESTDFYVLHPEVKRVALGLTAASRHPWEAAKNNLRRLKQLRREIRASEPDVIISFMDWTNIPTLLASTGLGTPVVVSVRADPRRHDIGWLWSTLRRLLYPRASALVVQSDEVRRWAKRFVQGEKIHLIPNPVTSPTPACGPSEKATYSPSSGPTVVAMGRLVAQKGFDLLLRAFARCAGKYPDWSLVILGEGEERERLETLAGELDITEKVSMPGLVKDPAPLLRQADLFVLSSRFEGFPNSLLEAMSCGLPVVSTDCPSGPGEIVRDGVDGVLVAPEDVGALATAMERLMSDEAERKRLSSRAVEVIERFGLEEVMGLWEHVLGQVVEEKDMIEHAKEVDQGERFRFGKNWSHFLKIINDDRIFEAEKSLKQMLEVEDLRGKSFLDIGSGSGLFSLAARRLGARVHSFDYDLQAVACTRELRRRYSPNDTNWTVEEGNALDREYIESLGKFDVVYSWGVLHHTGDMWQALDNVWLPVARGGKLFIAIYNDQGLRSVLWKRIKRTYNRLPQRLKLPFALLIMGPREIAFGLKQVLKLQPLRFIRAWTQYNKNRGMSRWHDCIDWVGGYPFEVAKPEEVFDFYRGRGFVLRRLTTAGGRLGNNQFVFERADP